MIVPEFLSGGMPVLATADFHSPVLWAVVLGWLFSVTLHEAAHGIVGYLGGDYTIRDRGLLTLNPLKYTHPLLSVIMPLVSLLLGRAPLAGGVTSIRRDLLRSSLWDTAVSLAGPATNFALFLLLALPFHPRFGWIHPSPFVPVSHWSSTRLFLGTMVVLQFLGCMINLIPIPPLDGFGAIKPYFDAHTQQLLSSQQVALGGLFLLWFLLPNQLIQGIYRLEDSSLAVLGFDQGTIGLIGSAYNKVMFNQ